jgi:hypothetical protein
MAVSLQNSLCHSVLASLQINLQHSDWIPFRFSPLLVELSLHAGVPELHLRDKLPGRSQGLHPQRQIDLIDKGEGLLQHFKEQKSEKWKGLQNG